MVGKDDNYDTENKQPKCELIEKYQLNITKVDKAGRNWEYEFKWMGKNKLKKKSEKHVLHPDLI